MSREPQNYANHVHNPQLAVTAFFLGLAALVCSVIVLFRRVDAASIALVLLGVAVILLAGIARIYIVRLQDRIIRAEMRMRVGARWPTRLADLERITMKQRVALRFASDAELPGLLDRAVSENLPPTDIKKAIKEWVPDYDRT